MPPTNSAAALPSSDLPAGRQPGCGWSCSSCRRRGRRREREAGREHRGGCERCTDAGYAGCPAKAVEQLAEHGTAGETAEEIAGKVGSTGDAAIILCGL